MTKQKFSIFMTISVLIFSLVVMVLPRDTVFAAIPDGRYELNYEMKEAHSENTSIADGYFTKPAILTVENGVQYIQMTVTGSNYIESLSAPSGPVEVISEDTTNFIRTVKFRVDGDLSKPLDMEMHIIVPDLYDMTHTARAVFDVSPIQQKTTANASQGKSQSESSNVSNQPVEKEKENTTVQNTDQDKNKEDSEEVAEEDADEDVDNEAAEEETESNENNEEEMDEEVVEEPISQVEDSEDDESSSSLGFVVLLIIGVLIVVLAIWLVKRNKSK